MDFEFFIPLMALVTMLIFLVFALVNMFKTQQRLDDPNATKSTLARDKRSDGKPADV